MAKDAKDDDETYSWEFLTRKTCGSALPHAVEPLPDTVSDEEIWERIDKDAEGNFDLKNTLDDGKVADDKADKLNEYMVDDDKDDTGDDDDLTDEDGDDDEEDEEDDDNAEEVIDDDDDVELKVKLNEKVTPVPDSASKKVPHELVGVKLNIKLMDKDVDDLETEEYQAVSSFPDEEHGRYEYLWPICIAILGALLLLLVTGKIVMMTCSKRNQQIRYNSAIIAAMQAGRTKKDCGLVYQQLSEDLNGPKTPKLSRYQPLQNVTVNATNLSYESSPFHHQNIVPENV